MISKLLNTFLLTLVSILVCFTAFGQVQLGSSIHGTYEYEGMGESVALNHAGDIMAVGIPNDYYTPNGIGRVAVYQFDGNDWELMGNEIPGNTYRGGFGHLVSINSAGNIIAVSERRSDYSNENIIYIYKYNGVDWVQLGQPVFSDVEADSFGVSLDLNASGNVIAIGSTSRTRLNQPGYVQVYKFENNSWQILGSRISGLVNRDSFGIDVSLNAEGNILAIGCRDAAFVSILGYAQVYQLIENEWEQLGETIYGENTSEKFGFSVSLNSAGNTLAISATPYYSTGLNYTRMSVLEFSNKKWIPKGNQIIDKNLVRSYAICKLNGDGNVLTYSTPGYNLGNGGGNIGRVKAFRFLGNVWLQMGNEIIGEGEGDGAGVGLSINKKGSRIAIGSAGNDNAANNAGQARVFDFSDILGTEKASQESIGIKLYPNPTDSKLSVRAHSPISSIEITNILGQALFASKYNSDKIDLDISFLSGGSYFIKVRVGDSYQVLRFIKR